jgi:hypothetical protein
VSLFADIHFDIPGAQPANDNASEDAERERDIELAWRDGYLSWLLRDHQLPAYEKYRAWEQLDPTQQGGIFARLFLLDVSKRWGKTTLRVVTRFEDCIRNPGRSYRYVTAFQKDIEEIVDDVARVVLDTCPAKYRPEYKLANKAQPAGFYFPERNGLVSVLKTAGLDKNPDALRGRASDGDDVSEAAFIRHLRYTVKNVLYHQYQGKAWARMCMESSAPVDVDTEYDRLFVEDAKKRDAYWFATIDDNTSLSDEEREEFIRAAGGRDHVDCKREYFCLRERDPERMLVPEFNEDLHVVEPRELPAHAHAYVGMDPGQQDKFGIVWAFWDFERAKLVVQRSYAESNVTTTPIADQLRVTERDLWGGLTYWNGTKFRANPFLRVSDTAAQVIADLSREHGITVSPTAKDDPEAQLYALRNAFMANKIEIWKDSGPLAAQLKAGTWNERRTDWERSEVHGHLDAIAALVYLWRNVARTYNPFPPEHVGKDPQRHHVTAQMRAREQSPAAKTFERALGGKNKWRPQRVAGRRW